MTKMLLAKIEELTNRIKSAVLIQKHNENTGTTQWALVSVKDHDKVLKWFGSEKPSDESILKEEKRVQWFKSRG